MQRDELPMGTSMGALLAEAMEAVSRKHSLGNFLKEKWRIRRVKSKLELGDGIVPRMAP